MIQCKGKFIRIREGLNTEATFVLTHDQVPLGHMRHQRFLQGLQQKAFSQEVQLLVCS